MPDTTPPKRGIPLARMMAYVVVCALAVFFLRATSRGIPDERTIHARGNELVAEVEAWRAQHGRYPASLAEADLAFPMWHHVGFRYRAERGKDEFVLSIREAGGWQMYHDFYSSAGKWSCHY